MTDDFWASCREYRIIIDLMIYPPALRDMNDMREKAKQKSIDVRSFTVTKFHAHKNLTGDSAPVKAMSICRSRYFCPFLRNGRLYICAMPALAHYFNHCFGTKIPDAGYVDIYSKNLTGEKCIELLNQPSPACRFCSYDFPQFDWQRSQKIKEEWDARWHRNDNQITSSNNWVEGTGG
jgi:hypothetical protein